MEVVFITWAKKRSVMCLCGVTGHSDHVDQTRRSVYPKLQCLQYDRTLANVRSALSGRVRSQFTLTGTLLMSTERWTSSVRSLAEQRSVSNRNLIRVRSALTGRVRSGFSLSGTLLESTERWPSASGHSTTQCLVAPDAISLIKWTDRTLQPASGQHLTLHSLPTLDHM